MAEQRNKFQCAARGCEGCTVCTAPSLTHNLSVREFEEWLDANRDATVSAVFHDVVAHYRAALTVTEPLQGTQEPVEVYTGGSFIRYVDLPAGFKMEHLGGDRWRVSPAALTDEQIARAIKAWFDDDGIEGNFELRMRNAILAVGANHG